MSPDFHYVIHLKQSSHATHTLGALFTFCLPASLIMLGLWHWLFKRPLLELLPDRQQQILQPVCQDFCFAPFKRFLLICLAALIGAATHVIWDSFTHPWGWPVQRFPFLQSIALSTSFQEFPVYKLLQYASSLFGTALVLLLYWRWQRRQPTGSSITPVFVPVTRLKIAGALFVLATMVAVIWAGRLFPPTASFYNFKAFVVRSIVIGTAVLGVELLLYSCWFRIRDPAGSTPSG